MNATEILIKRQVHLDRAVFDGDPDTLDHMAGYLSDLADLFQRMAAAGRAQRERREQAEQDRDQWFNAAARARDLVVTGHPPDLAAAIAANAFGQDQDAIRRALDADGVRAGPNARFQRYFLCYQMSRAGLTNRQIAASFMGGVSEATISRAIRRFQKEGPASERGQVGQGDGDAVYRP